MGLRVLCGMSGGVDSSAAAALLQAQGYDVAGATMLLKPRRILSDAEDARMRREAADAAAVCAKLGIEHFTLDFSEAFDRLVIQPFIESYRRGRTPNPCYRCNCTVKFGLLLDWALENGFDRLATGHYAEIVRENGRALLKRVPSKKDQSYFLSGLTPHQLKHVLIPLERMEKSEARATAAQLGLPVAEKPDSQEICFIPSNDYIAFLERFGGALPGAGDFIAPDGTVLGRHGGVHRYTVGQRKGLGVTFGEPRFVTKVDAMANTVTLGRNEECMQRTVRIEKLNFILCGRADAPQEITCKLRSAAPAEKALLTLCAGDAAQLVFEREQRAVTPGQIAAMYCGDYVLGSGIIQE